MLAKPKQRHEGPFRDPEWTVSTAARQATPSDRVTDLAKSKKLAEGYHPSREVVWRVGVGARNAVASNRLEPCVVFLVMHLTHSRHVDKISN